jgi:hypothetical protein
MIINRALPKLDWAGYWRLARQPGVTRMKNIGFAERQPEKRHFNIQAGSPAHCQFRSNTRLGTVRSLNPSLQRMPECTGSCSDLLHRIRKPFINVKPLRVNRQTLQALSPLAIADKKQQQFSPARALRNHRIATGSKG